MSRTRISAALRKLVRERARGCCEFCRTGKVEVLFHPRLDDWAGHFRFTGPMIEACTGRGRATVNTLRLNAPEHLRLRAMLMESGRKFA